MVSVHSTVDCEDMKRRLLETERKLLSLNKLEDEVRSLPTPESFSKTSQKEVKHDNLHSLNSEHHRDTETESINSLISTIPDSYTGFANQKVKSSTPSNMYRTKDGNPDKHERKLLTQNQRLLEEVERLIGRLHESRQENSKLSQDAEKVKIIPDLEEKIQNLVAENQVSSKALRTAEKQIIENHKQIDNLEGQVADLKDEIEEQKLARKEVEKQRDTAMQNLLDVQETLEDYQRRSNERTKKLEVKEDELRDDLESVSQERDELLERIVDFQTTVSEQEEQIHRLLNDIEKEDSRNQETTEENKVLQKQLDYLSEQIGQFEAELKSVDLVKKEKKILESELDEHRYMAQDLEALLRIIQHRFNTDDSGNCSSQVVELNMNNNGLGDEYDFCASASCDGGRTNHNNSGLKGCEGKSNMGMMGELRNLVTNMDGEIQRLRCDLKQRESDEMTYINLRDELKVLMDKVESGMNRNAELECLLSTLEDEKTNLCSKLEEALGIIEDRENQIQCLDTRVAERNAQIICLQETISEREQKLCCLQREMDSQVGGDQAGQLASCVAKLKAAEEKIKELEAVLQCKEGSLTDMQERYAKMQKDLRTLQVTCDKKCECLYQQIHEYERQTQTLTQELEDCRRKHVSCSKLQEDSRRQIRNKDDQLKCLESKVDELNNTLEEERKLHVRNMDSLNERLKKAQEQGQQLECALTMCKNEVAMHLTTMEEIKNHFECELSQREECIRLLREELRNTQEQLKAKVEHITCLERGVQDLKCKLGQASSNLKDCENSNCILNEKLKQTESLMLKEKATCMKETEELERKLVQTCNNLTCANNEIRKLKQCIQEKSSQLDQLSTEKNCLCRDLQKCKDVACSLQDKVKKMESDNQELCRQLQQKMDCIKDLESALTCKDQELKNCTCCLQEVQEKFRGYQHGVGSMSSESNKMKEELEKCCEELSCKSKLLCEMEECYKLCKLELEDKCEEIRLLKITLEDVNCKLHGRIERVEELEKAIENLHKEMEKRMSRVDEQLKRYECELSEKTKQVADLGDCLNKCQQDMGERENDLCQMEQKNQRLCSELNNALCRLKECKDTCDCLTRELNEKKAENAELCQELRVTREQMQGQYQELLDVKQALCSANRDFEKVSRDVEEMRCCLQQKDIEISNLCEQKNCLTGKVTQLTCRLESETCQLQNQMAEIKSRMEKEMDELRCALTEQEENNCCLVQKLSAAQRSLGQVEKCCHQKLESLNREVEDLTNRLADREDQILQCNECLNLKDSEIMRLKLRLCNPCTDGGSGNRPCGNSSGNKSCNNNNGDPDQAASAEQDPLMFTQDNLGKHVQLEINHILVNNESDLPKDTESGDRDSTGTRKSLGVSEVHERLRSNELRQREIERQLQSLEEDFHQD